MKKFVKSFKHALDGLILELKRERNLKIDIIIMIFIIILGVLFKISNMEWIICIILFASVISAELFNTAIERIVDVIMPEKNDKAKAIKDISAGAVLVLAVGSGIIGLFIFYPKILQIISNISFIN